MFAAIRRSHRPPALFGALLAASLVLRCAGRDVSQSSGLLVKEAGATGTGGAAPSPNIFLVPGTGGAPAPRDATPPRNFYCADASVAADCELRMSVCDGPTRLVSLSDPVCVYGQCRWRPRVTACAGACSDAGCPDASPPAQDAASDAAPQCSSSDSSMCQLPASICLDDSTLLYFVNPRCEAGRCESDAMIRACLPGGCNYGGCYTGFTH